MRVVVAPDKFKGSLTAAQVAERVAAGLARAVPGVEVVRVPVADGGDGTLEAAVSAGYRRVPVRVEGPTGDPVDTAYAERDGVAVVELADVSGLRRLPGGRLAARAASRVPSPPSATGTLTTSTPGAARVSPAATRSATCAAVREPLNLSGATTTRTRRS